MSAKPPRTARPSGSEGRNAGFAAFPPGIPGSPLTDKGSCRRRSGLGPAPAGSVSVAVVELIAVRQADIDVFPRDPFKIKGDPNAKKAADERENRKVSAGYSN